MNEISHFIAMYNCLDFSEDRESFCCMKKYPGSGLNAFSSIF